MQEHKQNIISNYSYFLKINQSNILAYSRFSSLLHALLLALLARSTCAALFFLAAIRSAGKILQGFFSLLCSLLANLQQLADIFCFAFINARHQAFVRCANNAVGLTPGGLFVEAINAQPARRELSGFAARLVNETLAGDLEASIVFQLISALFEFA